MIKRDITPKAKQLAKKFPVLAVVGPRQSGKTTFVKNVFPNFEYFNLEEPDTKLFATQDPRSFLNQSKRGMIIDEAQKCPEIFSYIQSFVDSSKTKNKYILTGSQNFLLHNKISQTLAGRVAILTLFPFSFNELKIYNSKREINEIIFDGFYPRIHDRKISPTDWLPNYIHTYIERDIRELLNVSNIITFTIFLKLCAGRIGQLFNISSIANEAGISVNTAKSWLNILEASYIIFRLTPHFENFSKRLVKAPKIYFCDTGLVCSLLGITKPDQILSHYNYGALVENLILSELLKKKYNQGKENNLYFWRDKTGTEIDCVLDNGSEKTLIEIKAGKTINQDYFKGIKYYQSINRKHKLINYLIYGGDKKYIQEDINILPWKAVSKAIE